MTATPNERWLAAPVAQRQELVKEHLASSLVWGRPILQRNINPLLPARTFPAAEPRLRWNGEKWCLLESLA